MCTAPVARDGRTNLVVLPMCVHIMVGPGGIAAQAFENVDLAIRWPGANGPYRPEGRPVLDLSRRVAWHAELFGEGDRRRPRLVPVGVESTGYRGRAVHIQRDAGR